MIFESFIAAGIISISDTKSCVVDDGHQHIIEFVRRSASQFTERRERLRLLQFVLQILDLMLWVDDFSGRRLGGDEAGWQVTCIAGMLRLHVYLAGPEKRSLTMARTRRVPDLIYRRSWFICYRWKNRSRTVCHGSV